MCGLRHSFLDRLAPLISRNSVVESIPNSGLDGHLLRDCANNNEPLRPLGMAKILFLDRLEEHLEGIASWGSQVGGSHEQESTRLVGAWRSNSGDCPQHSWTRFGLSQLPLAGEGLSGKFGRENPRPHYGLAYHQTG